MKLATSALSFVAVALVAASALAEPRPVVCLAFTETTMPVDGAPTKVAVCTDRKKPVILTTYTIASVKDAEGRQVRAAVGYR